jgi:hypothetical protein
MSLEEAVSQTEHDNELIPESSDEASTTTNARTALIDKMEADIINRLVNCWYCKYPMPQAAAALKLECYADRIPGLSGYVERQCNKLREHGVHICIPSCDPENCELMARTSFRWFQLCYLLRLTNLCITLE